MKRVLAVAVLGLAIVGAATAATGWTPAQTADILTSPSTTFYGSPRPAHTVTTARCVGAGSKSHGLYSAFSCAMTWPNPNGIGQVQTTEFVRPWSQQAACLTNVSLGACPPAPPAKSLPRDPRRCGAPDFARCMLNAANAAATSAEKAAGDPAPANTCKATSSWTSYLCSGATVQFVSAPAGWTVKTTLNG